MLFSPDDISWFEIPKKEYMSTEKAKPQSEDREKYNNQDKYLRNKISFLLKVIQILNLKNWSISVEVSDYVPNNFYLSHI